MSDKRKGSGAAPAAAILVALGVLVFGGRGFLPGNGFGLLPGDSNRGKSNIEETQTDNDDVVEDEAGKEETEKDENEEDIPATIIVSIKEDQVTINGHPVKNENELRQYIEDYNSDTRTFILEEDQSILETYNWVKGTFTALDIELKNSN